MSDVLQYMISGITIGSIFALVALGFHLVFKATEIFNFAQGTFVVFGGLCAYTMMVTARLNLILVLVLVTLLGLLTGWLLERIIRRPLLSGAHVVIIIATIAIGILLENAYLVAWSKDCLPFPPFTAGPPIELAGTFVPRQSLWVVGLTIVVVSGVKMFFKFTLVGQAMEACAINSLAASGVGINVERMIVYSLAMSTALAFLAGAMIAPITFAGGPAGPGLSVKGFVSAILGGIEDANAVILGGLLYGLMEAFIGGMVSSGLKEAIALSLLVAIFALKPTGIFVKSRAKN